MVVFAPAIAEIFLASVAVIFVLLAAFIPSPKQAARVMRKASLATLALTAGIIIVYCGMLEKTPAFAFGDAFFSSPFTTYMKLLVLAGAMLVLVLSKRAVSDEALAKPEFSLLILFSVLGMLILISANDLLTLYMGLELQSLPLYVIAAMQRDSLRSSEAGLKYFLLGALSSGLLLYGLSLIYGFTGATNYTDIAEALSRADGASAGAVIGIVIMIAGVAFKISAAPFHMWTPDVYEGSPTIVTAFFAVAPKVAAMTLFLRLTYGMLAPVPEVWQQVIIALAVLSMLVGSLGALMQSDLKRLMAYSSIAHMGYALVGLASAEAQGVGAVMLYMTIYMISVIGVFGIILMLARDGVTVHRIADLKGFSKSHPLPALCMMVFMFSMAGIPPLGGFFGKWFSFLAAVEGGLIWLAVLGVLASVVGAFYYLRIIKYMYFDDSDSPLDAWEGHRNMLVIGIVGLLVAGFLLFLSPLRGVLMATQGFVVFG